MFVNLNELFLYATQVPYCSNNIHNTTNNPIKISKYNKLSTTTHNSVFIVKQQHNDTTTTKKLAKNVK